MDKRISELQKKIDDLKKRFPAHSVKPVMVEELEELEEQLADLKTSTLNKNEESV